MKELLFLPGDPVPIEVEDTWDYSKYPNGTINYDENSFNKWYEVIYMGTAKRLREYHTPTPEQLMFVLLS